MPRQSLTQGNRAIPMHAGPGAAAVHRRDAAGGPRDRVRDRLPRRHRAHLRPHGRRRDVPRRRLLSGGQFNTISSARKTASISVRKPEETCINFQFEHFLPVFTTVDPFLIR